MINELERTWKEAVAVDINFKALNTIAFLLEQRVLDFALQNICDVTIFIG
jgi:hypothetical protein